MATGCDDRLVRIWDVETGGRVATLEGHADRVYSVVFSPRRTMLASASNDGEAGVWELRPGQPWQPLLLHTLDPPRGTAVDRRRSTPGRPLLATAATT